MIANGFTSLVATKSYHADNPYFMEGELTSTPNFGLYRYCESASNEKCFFGNEPEMLLVGDSFAMHPADALKQSPSTVPFMQLTAPSCPPVFDYIIHRVRNENRPENDK